MKVRLEVDQELLHSAVNVAESFAKEFPDWVGVRNCCIYGVGVDSVVYAYRTKGGTIVVRGV